MRLVAYSSIAGAELPNLVGLQDEKLGALPTVLVCPLKGGIALTSLRVEVQWAGKSLIGCPELARPIRRTALQAKGWLEEEPSRKIMERFQLLLAR
ncbi:hypothetical protein BH18VER2_BH18VER2_10720 [soil metagenome]